MTRDNEIANAASEAMTETLMSCPMYEFSPKATDLLECAYIKGAEWADSHPINTWHSIADGDLPKESKGNLFDLTFLVCMTNGRMFPAFYDIKDRTFTDEFNEIIKVGLEYWMEIPQLPTEYKQYKQRCMGEQSEDGCV